jgi:hypothetical protein
MVKSLMTIAHMQKSSKASKAMSLDRSARRVENP